MGLKSRNLDLIVAIKSIMNGELTSYNRQRMPGRFGPTLISDASLLYGVGKFVLFGFLFNAQV